MKSVEEQMSFYEAYHKHPLNKATHFIGIPSIVFSILIPLGWLGVTVSGYPVTAAMLVIAGVLAYYFALDVVFGAAMTAVLLPLLWAAHQVATWPILQGALMFLAFFVGGWVFQLIGHYVFEKRKPALLDNLFQLVVGPVFLCAELFFMLGFKEEMHQKVVAMSREHALPQPSARQ